MVNEKLPVPQDKIRRRVTEQWILSRPSIDERIEGVATIYKAFTDVIEPMFGFQVTRAVCNRAVILARQRFPELGQVVATGVALDVGQLRENLGQQDADRSCQALVALVDVLFGVLYQLLGVLLLQLLGEVESELRTKEARRRTDEETR